MALKSISDFEEDYENSDSDERNEAEIKNIEDTFNLAQRLLDIDYLPKIKKAILSDPSFRELEPYFFAFKSLNLFTSQSPGILPRGESLYVVLLSFICL